MIAPNAQDEGPWRIDQVRAIWWRIERTIDALHEVGALALVAVDVKTLVDELAASGLELTSSEALTKALRVLALQDGMHAADWLRMKAVEAQMPRRKPPAAVELQLRLRGVACRRLVAQLDEETGTVRVTIKNMRGDVASVQSESFANALEGAIKMSGARAEGVDDENV